MIEQHARVVRLLGDAAEVETERQAACGICSASKGCGTALLADAFPKRQQRMRVSNGIGAQQGDRVVIGLDERALQRASYLLYGLPLLGLIGGALLGDAMASNWHVAGEPAAAIGGLCGVIAALLFARRRVDATGADDGAQVKLLRLAGRRPTVTLDGLSAMSADLSRGVSKSE